MPLGPGSLKGGSPVVAENTSPSPRSLIEAVQRLPGTLAALSPDAFASLTSLQKPPSCWPRRTDRDIANQRVPMRKIREIARLRLHLERPPGKAYG